MSFIFNKNILNKYNVRYFYCPKCGYLTTEDPFWLKEAYSNAIAITDIGLISRNIEMSKLLACTLHFIVKNKDRCIDISGGYGILCRIMRDYGFHYYWDDPYCQNLFAKGFEAASHPGYFPVASFFEVIEHTQSPMTLIEDIIKKYQSSFLIFSTELYKGKPPIDWWYYALETGQHISFFNKVTLGTIARRLNMNLYSKNNIHILTTQKINKLKFTFGTNKFLSSILSLYIKYVKTSLLYNDYMYTLKQI